MGEALQCEAPEIKSIFASHKPCHILTHPKPKKLYGFLMFIDLDKLTKPRRGKSESLGMQRASIISINSGESDSF